jgi:hypothetical protein
MRSLVRFAIGTKCCRLALALGLLQLPAIANAEARRALLVGINTYELPPGKGAAAAAAAEGCDRGWINLEGTRNDIEGMRALLVGRFGFEPRNIVVLQDSAATRNTILTQMRRHLLAPSQRGDVCVFYFAGHGSQVLNLKSVEADKLDETIVPADRRDIRDKELARLFNDLVDRGALVTAFFDCCHSGSISRGLGGPARLRGLRPDMRDVAVADADPRGAPADRGALVFSASQEAQKAAEISDGDGKPHGVFSFMLAKTLRAAPAGEPAGRIATRVRALVAASEAGQAPALAASEDRLAEPLFGGRPLTAEHELVLAVEGLRGDHWQIRGGSAVGLYPGCEIVPASTGEESGHQAQPMLRLRIDSVDGPGKATAVCVQGDPQRIKPGDLFQVDRWVAAPDARLRFWTSVPIDPEVLQRAVVEFGKLARNAAVRWVADPTEQTPTHMVSWTGSTWVVSGPSNRPVEVAASAARVLEVLGRERSPGPVPAVFVLIPPSAAVITGLALHADATDAPAQLVRKESAAQYVLGGRIEQGHVEYAWAARNATRSDLEGVTSMPARTHWFRLGKGPDATRAVADSLQDRAFRLARVHGWLQLDSPPGVLRFPYHLVLRDPSAAPVPEGGVVHNDDKISLSLEGSQRDLELGSSSFYVYVFTIDSSGKSVLVFGDQDSGNCLPLKSTYVAGIPPARIPLTSVTVGTPFGTDTYVLLTSKEALDNPRQALEFDGVRDTPRRRGGGTPASPLDALLTGLNSRTRGARVATPATWSVERLAIRSQP